MIRRSTLIFLLTVAALLFCPALLGVEIDSRVINAQGGMDRSIQLILMADGIPEAEPDFTPLMADFSILHRSRNQSIKTINGQTSRTVRWTLRLLPRRTGITRIPVIQFGGDRSPPVYLTEAGIGIEEAFPRARAVPPAMPILSVPQPAVRSEARPPITASPPPSPAPERAEAKDAASFGVTEMVLLGVLGGLASALIKGYRNRRQRPTIRAPEKAPSPTASMGDTERVIRHPAYPARSREVTVAITQRNLPSVAVPAVTTEAKQPAPLSNELPKGGITTPQHLSPPAPMTRLEGKKGSTTPFPDHREVAEAVLWSQPSPPEQAIRKESAKLHQACLSTDPELAGAALLEWARERWPDAPPHTLGSLASQFAGTDVEREIRRLDKILYSPVKKEWHGATLWQVMKGFMVEQEVAPKKRHLFASFHIG